MDSAAYACPVNDVATELQRIRRRWQALPEPVTDENAAVVRELAQRLADEVRELAGKPRLAIPDLGAAAAVDQLTVMVYDACRAGLDDAVLQDLTVLRRSLP